MSTKYCDLCEASCCDGCGRIPLCECGARLCEKCTTESDAHDERCEFGAAGQLPEDE